MSVSACANVLLHFVSGPPSLVDLDVLAMVELVEQQVVLLRIGVSESVLHLESVLA